MRINTLRIRAGLLILLAMGLTGGRRGALARCPAAAGGAVPRWRSANAVAADHGAAHP